MKNLTTQKIVLGLLVAFVLALGVQGTADALTFGTSRSGDLQTVREDREFKISFSVSLRGASIKSGYKSTPRASIDTGVGTTTYYNDTGDTGYQSETQVLYDAAHDYDQESISITVPSGITVQKINGHNPVGVSPYAMYESTHISYATASDSQKLSSRVELSLMAADPGAFEITITGTTDDPSGSVVTNAPPFTVYIVAASLTVDATTLTGLTNGSTSADDTDDPQLNTSLTLTGGTVNTNVPMTYKVTGPGRVYVSIGERRLSATATLHTSSAAPVYLDMNGGTNRIEVSTPSASLAVPNVYIYGRPTMTVTHGAEQEGIVNGRLDDYLAVQVKDAKNRPISGLAIDFASGATAAMFTPVAGFLYGPNMMLAKPTTAPQPTGLDVYTDRNGEAKVYYKLGSESTENQRVTATLTSRFTVTATFDPTIGSGARRPTLSIVSGNNQRTDENGEIKDPLVVVVRRNGHRLPAHDVIFVAQKGVVTSGSRSNQRVTVPTDSNGEAEVMYDQNPGSGRDTVTASITSDGIDPEPPIAYEKAVTFGINGAPSSGGDSSAADDRDDDALPARGSLSISVSPDTGSTRTVTVTALNPAGTPALGISVILNVSNGATLSRTSGPTPLTSTLTLPGTAGDFVLTATTTADYTSDTETITVTLPGTLGLALIGDQVNGQQTVQVTARNAAGTLETTQVTVTLSGAGISRTVDVTGSQNVPIALPTTSGTLTARATGYNPGSVTLPARAAGTTTTTTTTTQTGTAGEADSIDIEGSRSIRGTVNQVSRLRVRVTDANNRGVSNVRVTYRVLAPGRGRLSQRGNGRAVVVQTDRNGDASASLTPLGGNLIVEAGAAGVSARVTFIIDVDGESVTPTTPRDTDTTPTPRRTIDPDVHVGAANRPPMLWIDGGSIYALVGADVQEFASGVEGAMNIAVGGGKVYWTEQTGESSGTINSANLDGSGMTELVETRWSVPMGIAVDTARSRLYWSNSSGKIKRANLNGSGITNVMQDLQGVRDIAVARGNLYWTQYDATEEEGNVGIVNPNAGRSNARYISTGSDAPGSIAIGGNTVYWTEQTGESSGTINSANLNGSGMTELVETRWSVPMGIAVDTARSRLYWSNSSGKIKNANLTGKQGRLVVDGLGMPGDMVLSNSIEAPAKTPTTDAEQTAATSKYDINGDGAVDSKDVDALIVAVAAGVTDAKYDVNGDGKVDIFDVSAVSSKRDAGAAAAPALLGTNLSIVQIDRLQEQIDLLVASNDRSPDTLRILTYLHQLIVMARPEKTQLLANYPNPFNPETWIPYELATDTEVRITIYNTHGVVIRTLELGHQSAGYYTGRDRAAYWDGRNALGEQVASGIYFYQFETDEMSSLRKMVILK